jgi:ABC-type phosphate transport system substrate-binding protein
MKRSLLAGSVVSMLLLLTPGMLWADDVVMIVNEAVPVVALSREEVKTIFLGKKTTWEDGQKIVFVVQDKNQTSDTFLKTYVRKNPYHYTTYWKKQVFTGKGRAPLSFATDAEIVAFVSSTPGAIGYVAADAHVEGAKIVAVEEGRR